MQRYQRGWFFLVLVIILLDFNSAWEAETETLRFAPFGTVTVYRQSSHPSHVFFSFPGMADGTRVLWTWPTPSVPLTLSLQVST
jgi:hypothetical protein